MHMRANSNAATTIPSGVSPYLRIILSEREPWFVPMRMALPSSLQRRTRGMNFSRARSRSAAYSASEYSALESVRCLSVKLPGFTRIFSTCSTASIAVAGRKCISATSGVSKPAARNFFEISPRAFAASRFCAVSLTIWHPASASCMHWRTEASTSQVFVFVIDCTTILSPPISTPPTWTVRTGFLTQLNLDRQ